MSENTEMNAKTEIKDTKTLCNSSTCEQSENTEKCHANIKETSESGKVAMTKLADESKSLEKSAKDEKEHQALLETNLESLTKRFDEQQAAVESIKTLFEEQIQKLKGELSEANNQIKDLKGELSKANNQIKTVKTNVAKLTKELTEQKKLCSKLNERLSDRWLIIKMLGQLFVPPTFIPDYTQEQSTSNDDSTESAPPVQDISQIKGICENFTSGRLDNYLNSFERHIQESLDDAKQDFQKDKETLNGRMREVNERLAKLPDVKSELDAFYKSVDAKLQNVKDEAAREISDCCSNIEKQSSDIDSIHNELAGLKSETNDAQNAIVGKLNSEFRKVASEINSVKTRLSDVDSRLVQSQNQSDAFEKTIAFVVKDTKEKSVQHTSDLNDLSKRVAQTESIVSGLVQNITNENTRISNEANEMLLEFGTLRDDIFNIIFDAENDDFDVWAFNYFIARLKNIPELPQWQGDNIPQVAQLKQVVTDYLAKYNCAELFKKTENCSLESCLIAPAQGEPFDDRLHIPRGETMPKKNDKADDFVIDAVWIPGLRIPSNPEKSIKAYVALKRK